MSLSRAMCKITEEHTNKLAYVFMHWPTSRGARKNSIGSMVPHRLVQQSLQLGWLEENIRVVAEAQGRRGSTAEGGSTYEQMLKDIADGRVGAVFSLEPSRVTRDIAAWHNFIKMCRQAGTMVINEQGLYNLRDADDNMKLSLMALIADALQRLFSSAEVLRTPFAKRRARTDFRRTSPVFAHHFPLIF